MGTSAFNDLRTYRQACALANRLRAEVLAWPVFDKWSLGVQVVRSADSVGANIAEAVGRQHRADRRRLLFVARGSLYETEHWWTQAKTRNLTSHSYEAELNELSRTLNGLIRWTDKGWR